MNILVVDDSSLSRRMVREDLKKGGYTVHEAASGEEALRMVAENPPHLITMDVTMASMNGYETTMLLRQQQDTKEDTRGGKENIPVIFVTANDSLEEREKGFEAGGTEFITKPFPRGALLRKVDALLRPPQPYRGIKVLVVDDSAVARMTLREGLARHGCEVVEAVDGNEGFEKAREMAGDLDLILSDYMMPGLNGEALVRQVRQVPGLEEIPFIMLSAVSDRSRVLDMFKAGTTDYLVKPFIVEELLARISVHLHSRQLTLKLKKNVEVLERLDRSKNEFLGVTAHDLRSPLMSMIGFFDLLQESSSHPDREFFRTHFHSAADQLRNLIDDLNAISQDLSLVENVALEPVNLIEILETCLSSFQPMAQLKSIDLRMGDRIEGAQVIVQGEPNGMLRVFNNLISNAIKFTPRDGGISLSIEPGDRGFTRVVVKDNGVGMDPEALPRLYDPGTRISRKGTSGEKGIGLGLSIVKQLLDRQGARLDVSTELGMGTAFMIDFPLVTLAS